MQIAHQFPKEVGFLDVTKSLVKFVSKEGALFITLCLNSTHFPNSPVLCPIYNLHVSTAYARNW